MMDLQAPLSPSAASSAYSRHMTCQMSHLLVYLEPHSTSIKVLPAMHNNAAKDFSE